MEIVYDFVEKVFWALVLGTFFSIPIIIWFGLFIVFQISSMFYVKNSLDFSFSFTDLLISSIISYTPDILSSISCILLVMIMYVLLVVFPWFSISRIASVCIFFNASSSLFRSWSVLFISFTSVIIFSCNYLNLFFSF